MFTWQATDQQVANARAKGVKVLGTITYTPDFARHPDCPDQPCAGSDHVRRLRPLSAKVAARYKGKVNAWEIWNEPNETCFETEAESRRLHARLLNLTYGAIKQVNIYVTVILGGLSTHCTNSGAFLTWQTFMDGFYRAGGAGSTRVRHPPVLRRTGRCTRRRATPSTTCRRRSAT